VVAIFSWKLSGWHKEGVIEAKKAELELLKVKLDSSVADANIAIEEMKKLGLVLAAPIVDELAVSGRLFQYINLSHKLERVEYIVDNLKKLGASQNEIDGVCETIYCRVKEDHIRRIIGSLREPNPDKKDLLKNILELELDEWNVSQINKLINDNNLKISEETKECFSDLEYFFKNRKLRREDKWQG